MRTKEIGNLQGCFKSLLSESDKKGKGSGKKDVSTYKKVKASAKEIHLHMHQVD